MRYFHISGQEKATGHVLSDSIFRSQVDCRYLEILRVVVDALQQERALKASVADDVQVDC